MGDSEWRCKRFVSQLAANDETPVCRSGQRWKGKSTSALSQSIGLLAWSLIAIGRRLKEVQSREVPVLSVHDFSTDTGYDTLTAPPACSLA